MTLRYNFSAGPSPLPEPVIEQIRADLPEWRGQGASIMEISHRSAAFDQVVKDTEADLRALLQLSDDYAILWMQGGASTQFSLVPMNLASNRTGGYVRTGSWSHKAWQMAAYHQQPLEVASSAPDFNHIPARDTWQQPIDLAYVHIASNETIHGVQFHHDADCGDTPLIIDSSSDFLSRPPVFKNFGMMYAGAQKNLGPAGITVAVIRRDLLQRCPEGLAPMFNYRQQAAKNSLHNTPPVFAWYVCGLVLRWIGDQGGLAAMEQRNRDKAQQVYTVIDADDFYRNPVVPEYRSLMNIPVRIHTPELEAVFLQEAEHAGFIGLKGHRSVGGLRISLYNAVTLEQTRVLTDFMHEFKRRHG